MRVVCVAFDAYVRIAQKRNQHQWSRDTYSLWRARRRGLLAAVDKTTLGEILILLCAWCAVDVRNFKNLLFRGHLLTQHSQKRTG